MSTPLLFRPLRFPNGVQTPNRLWLAPLTNLQSHADGTLSEQERDWLLGRARRGYGVTETCAVYVSPEGKAWPGELGLCSDAHEASLTGLGPDLAEAGSLGVVQLFHGGARASQEHSGLPTWSASTWTEDGASFVPPRTATEADLQGVIVAFRQAAVRAARLGFAGVELHGAHGYLFSQFLSHTQNPRTDRWGGDLEGRARLLRETLAAVRAAVPRDFLVGVRLSPEAGGQAQGLDLDDSLQVATWLAAEGADFLHLSLWDSFANTRKRPDQHPLPLFRAVVGDLPLVAAGHIWSRAEADRVLELGADMVALGRAAICWADWPQGARDPAFDPARPPFSAAHMDEQDIQPDFQHYLRRFGLMQR